MKAILRTDLTEYIFPLNMNGLQGRMLRVPAPANKSREILFVYGHHATIERWSGLIHELNKYGGVTVPDLPGFGGMASFYKIGEKPDINTYADYLAAFVKLRYNQRRLSIVAEGFGFVVATRMLARYPAVARKVDLILSLAGFTHKDDVQLNKRQLQRCRYWCKGLSWLPTWSLRYLYIQPMVLRRYRPGQRQHKARLLEATAFPARPIDQAELWRRCDLRTHLATITAMLAVDNCDRRITVPAWHVALPTSPYLNAHFVEQHLHVTFETCHLLSAKTGRRRVFDTSALAAAPLLPSKLRRALNRR